jgi:hypothetical protein
MWGPHIHCIMRFRLVTGWLNVSRQIPLAPFMYGMERAERKFKGLLLPLSICIRHCSIHSLNIGWNTKIYYPS